MWSSSTEGVFPASHGKIGGLCPPVDPVLERASLHSDGFGHRFVQCLFASDCTGVRTRLGYSNQVLYSYWCRKVSCRHRWVWLLLLLL